MTVGGQKSSGSESNSIASFPIQFPCEKLAESIRNLPSNPFTLSSLPPSLFLPPSLSVISSLPPSLKSFQLSHLLCLWELAERKLVGNLVGGCKFKASKQLKFNFYRCSASQHYLIENILPFSQLKVLDMIVLVV